MARSATAHMRQAATLCFGLVKNHPLAWRQQTHRYFLMETFLGMNGLELLAGDREIVAMILAVEADEWKVAEIASWLRERVTPAKA
jgi:death on curing protein